MNQFNIGPQRTNEQDQTNGPAALFAKKGETTIQPTDCHQGQESLMRLLVKEMSNSLFDECVESKDKTLKKAASDSRFVVGSGAAANLQHINPCKRASLTTQTTWDANSDGSAESSIDRWSASRKASSRWAASADLDAMPALTPPSLPHRRGDRNIDNEAFDKSPVSDASDTLSMSEIKKYVINNLPQESKGIIGTKVWNQIFGESDGTSFSTSGSGSTSRLSDRVKPPRRKASFDQNTVVSDITSSTGDTDRYDNNSQPLSPSSSRSLPLYEEEESESNNKNKFKASNAARRRKSVHDEPDDPRHFGISAHERFSSSVDSSGPTLPKCLSDRLDAEDLEHERQFRSVSRNSSDSTNGYESNKRESVPRSVKFGNVEVRHYERILTDNPSCREGPPIGIGWWYVPCVEISLDDWEEHREATRYLCELHLTKATRLKMLKDLGYTQKEIADMVRKTRIARYQRKQTIDNLGKQRVEEVVESARTKVKKILRFRKSKRR